MADAATASKLESAEAKVSKLAAELESRIRESIKLLGARLEPTQVVEGVSLALSNVLKEDFQSEFKDFVKEPSSPTPAAAAVPKRPVRVYLDGCFDIMHSGHYNAIRQAKALGDILVVGVHSDEEILQHKGPPVMNDEERVAVVKACKWVDEVAFGTPYNPSVKLLDDLNCDFVVHGDDMATTADGHDAYGDVKKQGRLRIVKRTEGVSTTDLVGRLLLMTRDHHIASPKMVPSEGKIASRAIEVPALSLGDAPASSEAAAVPAATTEAAPAPAASEPAAVAGATRGDGHYASGISNFLPTTWRITQFSNHRIPKPEDKVVYIDGAFDLFHVGHIETLAKAKELGTFLYVGVHDDATVNHYKGRNYPIMNLHERVLNVLSCKVVDEVVIGAPWVVRPDLIKTLGIHVVTSGSNTKMDQESTPAETDVDPYATPKAMGIYQTIETSRNLVTEDVVRRILENRMKYEKRNASRSKKEISYMETRSFVAEI